MSKRVVITPEIQKAIRNSAGDPELDTSNFVVFECRALSTEPLSKNGFYNKAKISHSTIVEMEAFLNRDEKALPLHLMHNDGLLPVGKVFKAATFSMPNGETELRAQFYLPASETDLVGTFLSDRSINPFTASRRISQSSIRVKTSG
jgi:hypothetical protein